MFDDGFEIGILGRPAEFFFGEACIRD
jgi:hypothetical protein